MRNRYGILIFALAALVLVLAACTPVIAPEAMETAPAPEETVTPAEEATPAASEEVDPNAIVTDFEDVEQGSVEQELVSSETSLDIWADETRAPVLRQIAVEFEAATGIPLTITELPFDQIRSTFEKAAVTDEGPDIIVGPFGWASELQARELLAEIDLGDKREEFLESAIDAFEIDGALYGMPYTTENLALVYNPELVVEPPTTWSELAALAAQLEADGVVEQGFIRQSGDLYHFYPILSAFGGYLFGEEGDEFNVEDLGVDGEGALAAFEWLASMVEAGSLDGAANVDYDAMHGAFESGDAAMMVTGPWALPRLRASGIPFVVTTLPGELQDAAPFLGVQGFMINSESENPELAQRFLTEFVATEEIMQEIFEGDPRPSALLSIREYIEDPDLYGFAAAGETGQPEPTLPEMSLIWEELDLALRQVAAQELTVEEALEQAAESIRADLAAAEAETSE